VETLSAATVGSARPRTTARGGSAPARHFARTPVAIVALDFPTVAAAVRLVERLGGLCRFYKVGSELFTAVGPAIVEYLRARGCDVFLDLKFHDIPNTVRRGSGVAAGLGVRLLTAHAAGGLEMVRAAVEGAQDGAARAGTECGVLGVTVLTSLDAAQLGAVRGRPRQSVEREVLRLADVSLEGGASGIVCAGSELTAVRKKFGEQLQVLVPGIRPHGVAQADQARTITPEDAAQRGADFVVVGRAVTQAPSPEQVMQAILTALNGGS
jgi:orotidine-5'-phosphate decarboxylase